MINPNGPEAPLPDDLPEMFEELMRRLDLANAELDDEIAQEEAASEQEDEKRARQARSGELGADWKTVQQRIDLNQTTLNDVFSGADDSLAATNLRRLSERNLETVRETWDKQAEESDAEVPAQQMDDLAREAHDSFAAAQQKIADILSTQQHRNAAGEEQS